MRYFSRWQPHPPCSCGKTINSGLDLEEAPLFSETAAITSIFFGFHSLPSLVVFWTNKWTTERKRGGRETVLEPMHTIYRGCSRTIITGNVSHLY